MADVMDWLECFQIKMCGTRNMKALAAFKQFPRIGFTDADPTFAGDDFHDFRFVSIEAHCRRQDNPDRFLGHVRK